MDISVEVIAGPQKLQRPVHLLGGIGGVPADTGTEKKPFDVVAPVKLRDKSADFLRSKSSARGLVGDAVDAVFAVVDTVVAQKDLQQGDAAAVGGKTVADAGGKGISKASLLSFPVDAAGCAGDIVLCRIRENIQFFLQTETLMFDFHDKPPVPCYVSSFCIIT